MLETVFSFYFQLSSLWDMTAVSYVRSDRKKRYLFYRTLNTLNKVQNRFIMKWLNSNSSFLFCYEWSVVCKLHFFLQWRRGGYNHLNLRYFNGESTNMTLEEQQLYLLEVRKLFIIPLDNNHFPWLANIELSIFHLKKGILLIWIQFLTLEN